MPELGETIKGFFKRGGERSKEVSDKSWREAMAAARVLKARYQWTEEEAATYLVNHGTPKHLRAIALPPRIQTAQVNVLLTVPLQTFERMLQGETVEGFWGMRIPASGMMSVEEDDQNDYWFDTPNKVRVMTRTNYQEARNFEMLERGEEKSDPIENDLSATYWQQAYYLRFSSPMNQGV